MKYWPVIFFLSKNTHVLALVCKLIHHTQCKEIKILLKHTFFLEPRAINPGSLLITTSIVGDPLIVITVFIQSRQ